MISLDSSILLRYITKDNARLAPVALAIITDNACFVSKAALMEIVFTLESVYRKSRDEIVTALRTIFGLTTVTVESQSVTAHAITWYAAGMDFGDAMILASSAGSDKVASFDRDFQRLAARIGATPRVEHFKA
ncbi:MAG: type II toxin-antitoxin system VapC family toxin [Betaproteobacteria bacterium]|nr:type II toxin-antitoxin system VapC family toxin [Betaproteobacteria bacterium]